MIIANGFQKAGNHALVKACQLLGVPCDVNHTPFGQLPKDTTKHILITRDPRNIIVSWLRFRNNPVTPGMFITKFRKFDTDSLVNQMKMYEGFLTDPNTLVVKYEDLVSSPAEMKRIADYLGVPYLDGAFEELPGMTRTWNDEHSDYKKIWTPEVEKVWVGEGGNDLLKKWNY